jgi:RNA polymerase sigma-70 factor (ECF subfamily)
VNGAYGIVAVDGGRRYSVVGFIVRDGKIAEIDIFGDPARLRQLDLAGLDG